MAAPCALDSEPVSPTPLDIKLIEASYTVYTISIARPTRHARNPLPQSVLLPRIDGKTLACYKEEPLNSYSTGHARIRGRFDV